MKKIKAQIKSEKRVKSMLDFSNNDEIIKDDILAENDSIPAQNDTNVVENDNIPTKKEKSTTQKKSTTKRTKSVNKSDDLVMQSVDDDVVKDDEAIAKDGEQKDLSQNSNGVIVLNRKRGDVVVSGQDGEDADELGVEIDVPKARHIVEIESKTYGDVNDADIQASDEKRTFKDYINRAGTTIAQGWDTFINRKGAVRFLAIIAVCVMLTLALIIYSATQRTNFKDIINGTGTAFVYDAGETVGAGKTVEIKVDDLTKSTPSEKLCKNYRTIELVGKNKKKAINIDTITFGLYTSSANVMLVVNIEIYVGENKAWTLETPRETLLEQRIGKGVEFEIGQSFDFRGATYIRMTFECYNAVDYINYGSDATRTNPQFAIYKLAYTN